MTRGNVWFFPQPIKSAGGSGELDFITVTREDSVVTAWNILLKSPLMPDPASAQVAVPIWQTLGFWQTVVGFLGFSSLIATWLAHWFSARRERLRWISDNKKAEWRELIDELDKILIAMSHAFSPVNVVSASDPWNDPMAGIGKGNRIIHDRIFIADALKKHGVLAKWEELVRYTSDASNPREPKKEDQLWWDSV